MTYTHDLCYMLAACVLETDFPSRHEGTSERSRTPGSTGGTGGTGTTGGTGVLTDPCTPCMTY